MPELPEAETIKRVIEPQIQGLFIEKVTVKRLEEKHTHILTSVEWERIAAAIPERLSFFIDANKMSITISTSRVWKLGYGNHKQ
ncbi:MAG: hypothetical protein NC416_19390 [Eubacterium sp.]|nr:hypothetical protein [Eubacterium sp.]